jgi:glutaredoxin
MDSRSARGLREGINIAGSKSVAEMFEHMDDATGMSECHPLMKILSVIILALLTALGSGILVLMFLMTSWNAQTEDRGEKELRDVIISNCLNPSEKDRIILRQSSILKAPSSESTEAFQNKILKSAGKLREGFLAVAGRDATRDAGIPTVPDTSTGAKKIAAGVVGVTGAVGLFMATGGLAAVGLGAATGAATYGAAAGVAGAAALGATAFAMNEVPVQKHLTTEFDKVKPKYLDVEEKNTAGIWEGVYKTIFVSNDQGPDTGSNFVNALAAIQPSKIALTKAVATEMVVDDEHPNAPNATPNQITRSAKYGEAVASTVIDFLRKNIPSDTDSKLLIIENESDTETVVNNIERELRLGLDPNAVQEFPKWAFTDPENPLQMKKNNRDEIEVSGKARYILYQHKARKHKYTKKDGSPHLFEETKASGLLSDYEFDKLSMTRPGEAYQIYEYDFATKQSRRVTKKWHKMSDFASSKLANMKTGGQLLGFNYKKAGANHTSIGNGRREDTQKIENGVEEPLFQTGMVKELFGIEPKEFIALHGAKSGTVSYEDMPLPFFGGSGSDAKTVGDLRKGTFRYLGISKDTERRLPYTLGKLTEHTYDAAQRIPTLKAGSEFFTQIFRNTVNAVSQSIAWQGRIETEDRNYSNFVVPLAGAAVGVAVINSADNIMGSLGGAVATIASQILGENTNNTGGVDFVGIREATGGILKFAKSTGRENEVARSIHQNQEGFMYFVNFMSQTLIPQIWRKVNRSADIACVTLFGPPEDAVYNTLELGTGVLTPDVEKLLLTKFNPGILSADMIANELNVNELRIIMSKIQGLEIAKPNFVLSANKKRLTIQLGNYFAYKQARAKRNEIYASIKDKNVPSFKYRRTEEEQANIDQIMGFARKTASAKTRKTASNAAETNRAAANEKKQEKQEEKEQKPKYARTGGPCSQKTSRTCTIQGCKYTPKGHKDGPKCSELIKSEPVSGGGRRVCMIIGKKSCPHSMGAVAYARQKNMHVRFVQPDEKRLYEAKQFFNHFTVPIVIVDGKMIGGFADLKSKYR